MADRKPPGLSFDSWVEQQIEKAREEGRFEDLPGSGKPLRGLQRGYDPDWWTKELLQREKLSLLPPALAQRRRVESELARIRRLRREEDIVAALTALNQEIAHTNATASEGPPTAIAKIDIDAFLERWRSGSGGGSA